MVQHIFTNSDVKLFSSDRLLVTGGFTGNTTDLEGNTGVETPIIDIWDDKTNCSQVEDIPEMLIGANGGVIQNRALICGGYNINYNISNVTINNLCYELGNETVYKGISK